MYDYILAPILIFCHITNIIKMYSKYIAYIYYFVIKGDNNSSYCIGEPNQTLQGMYLFNDNHHFCIL